jgi:hypothetical protein
MDSTRRRMSRNRRDNGPIMLGNTASRRATTTNREKRPAIKRRLGNRSRRRKGLRSRRRKGLRSQIRPVRNENPAMTDRLDPSNRKQAFGPNHSLIRHVPNPRAAIGRAAITALMLTGLIVLNRLGPTGAVQSVPVRRRAVRPCQSQPVRPLM